jgi:uncharacterized Zn finger protein (UPF0148 family)
MDGNGSGWRCDRCGFPMIERSCKVTCMNCGQRWDCSDLTIWVADGRPRRQRRQPDADQEGRDSRDRPEN